MRRLLAIVTATLLVTLAACSSDNTDTTGSDGNTAATATAAAGDDNTGDDNTKQVCADARTVFTDSTEKFTEEISKAMTLAASGGASTAEETALNSVKALFGEWAGGLREQAAKATNPELKAALGEIADGIAKVADKIKTMADLEAAHKLLDTPELTAAGEKLEALCS